MRVRSPLFSQGFFRHLVLQQGIGQQPLEPAVLSFQLLEALGVGDAHATEFVAPEVVAGLREAVAATQIRHRQTRLRFPQKANDLLFRKSLLHVQSPVTWDWTPESVATQIRGDVDGYLILTFCLRIFEITCLRRRLGFEVLHEQMLQCSLSADLPDLE